MHRAARAREFFEKNPLCRVSDGNASDGANHPDGGNSPVGWAAPACLSTRAVGPRGLGLLISAANSFNMVLAICGVEALDSALSSVLKIEALY